MVQKVIDLQRMKADASGIALYATFPGIRENNQVDDGHFSAGFSPIIYSDELRIMQVLLNL